MASKQKIAVMVAMLCEAFGRKPTPATFMAYEIGLADVTDDALELAVRNALAATGDFMPTPGALRAIARTNGVGREPGRSEGCVSANY